MDSSPENSELAANQVGLLLLDQGPPDAVPSGVRHATKHRDFCPGHPTSLSIVAKLIN
jgi:hypothetical protein